jgi:hypothetical protein
MRCSKWDVKEFDEAGIIKWHLVNIRGIRKMKRVLKNDLSLLLILQDLQHPVQGFSDLQRVS